MRLFIQQYFRRTTRKTIVGLNINREYFTRKIVHAQRLLWYDPSCAEFSNTSILKFTPRSSSSLSSTFQRAKFRFKDIVKTGSFEEPPNPVLHGLIGINDEGNQYSFKTFHPKFSQIEPEQHLLPALQISARESELAYKEFLSWIECNVHEDGTFRATEHEIKTPVIYTCRDGFPLPLEDIVLYNIEKIIFKLKHIHRIMVLYRSVRRIDPALESLFANMEITFRSSALEVRPVELVNFALERLIEKRVNDKFNDQDEYRNRALRSTLEGFHLFTSEDISKKQRMTVERIHSIEEEFTRNMRIGTPSLPSPLLRQIYELVGLKKELAVLSGYPNYACMYLSKYSMAGDVEEVTKFHDNIVRDIGPLATSCTDKKLADNESFNKTNNSLSYLTEWHQNEHEIWKECQCYFELNLIIDGLFDVVRRLFGIVIKPADDKVEVWHPDVKCYNVYNEGELEDDIATIYIDFYERPLEKEEGSFHLSLLERSQTTSGRKIKPLSCILLNISQPMWETDSSLLRFNDVVDIFHEFGHCLQNILSNQDISFISGTVSVEFDATEFPAKFMELWIWDKKFLTNHAKHYQTGEPMPQDLIQALKSLTGEESKRKIMDQIISGQLELDLLSSFDPNGNQSIMSIEENIRQRYDALFDGNEKYFSGKTKRGIADISTLQHIFERNAGSQPFQYRYLWSEVMALDAFSAFQDIGLDNEEELKKLGRRFRSTVLGLGGGIDSAAVFERFRGRKVILDPFLKHHSAIRDGMLSR